MDFSELSQELSSVAENMFNGCINLKFVNFNNLKIYEATNYMFAGCKSLTSIVLSNMDFSNENI